MIALSPALPIGQLEREDSRICAQSRQTPEPTDRSWRPPHPRNRPRIPERVHAPRAHTSVGRMFRLTSRDARAGPPGRGARRASGSDSSGQDRGCSARLGRRVPSMCARVRSVRAFSDGEHRPDLFQPIEFSMVRENLPDPRTERHPVRNPQSRAISRARPIGTPTAQRAIQVRMRIGDRNGTRVVERRSRTPVAPDRHDRAYIHVFEAGDSARQWSQQSAPAAHPRATDVHNSS